MAIKTIPLTANAFYTFDIELDGKQCRFTFRWNTTDNAWYMNIEGISFELLLTGIKCVSGANLLAPYAVIELGGLYIIDTEDKNRDPDFDNFGDVYKLLYVEK